jgi:hypothetical protein
MKEAAYGVILTGSIVEVKMFDRTLEELKELAFVDEDMGPNDFLQRCFEVGYNEYLKDLANYYELDDSWL